MENQCEKCGYQSEEDSEFKTKFGLSLCNVCCTFSPNTPEKLDEYVQEKVKSEEIYPFRKYAKTRGEVQKKGMIEKASKGKHVSRVPFGYRWDFENKQIVPSENYREVEEIFEEFLQPEYSLTQLAKKHSLSINGLKKILRNFAYIGKVKFNGEIHQGNHKPIISSMLFNKVQEKLDKTEKKK